MTLDLLKQANPVLYDNKAWLMNDLKFKYVDLVSKILNSKIHLWYKISKSQLELAMLGVLPCLFIDATVNGNTRILKVQSRVLVPHYLTPISWPLCWWYDCYLHFFSLSSSLFGRKQYWYQPIASHIPWDTSLAQYYYDSYYSFWSKQWFQDNANETLSSSLRKLQAYKWHPCIFLVKLNLEFQKPSLKPHSLQISWRTFSLNIA